MTKKYIDAEKLIAAIEKRLKNIRDYINGTGMKYKGPKFYKARGKESAYDELLSIIYFLQQEQPEADLEKEIDACWQDWLSPSNQKEVEGVLPKIEFATYARHFHERGQSTQYQKDRAEFAKLKAEEWQKGFDEGLNARKV